MRPEYDFSGAVRGMTARRYAEGANVVVAPDLLEVFADANSVDEGARMLAPMAPTPWLVLTRARDCARSAGRNP